MLSSFSIPAVPFFLCDPSLFSFLTSIQAVKFPLIFPTNDTFPPFFVFVNDIRSTIATAYPSTNTRTFTAAFFSTITSTNGSTFTTTSDDTYFTTIGTTNRTTYSSSESCSDQSTKYATFTTTYKASIP